MKSETDRMELSGRLREMRTEAEAQLRRGLLPFWLSLKDTERGGFVSYVGYDLRRAPQAMRGCILNSRILWFFSQAWAVTGEAECREAANHAYAMLRRMTDIKNGGVYWGMHADGTVADSTKHTYNQAFAIYALSAYARLLDHPGALAEATALFELIEERCRDEGGYPEAFTADWQPGSNEKLSENGVMATRTMNTLLHVLEAYTGLYEAGGDPRVRARLEEILDIWEERIYNPRLRRQEVFFDHEYHTLIDLHSYGHDIETSWLCDHTLEVLGDPARTARVRPMLLAMAEETLKLAWTEGNGFSAEMERGVVDTTRVWWVQAEAVLGFLNAYGHTGEERYLSAARNQWDYIRDRVIDPRCGEWHWSLTLEGKSTEKPFVEPWKCPYHNGRMCLEVLRRGIL